MLQKEGSMNEDIFEGKWQQMKGKVKEKWGKLTDNDLTRINGARDQLLGSLQEAYGWQKERAEEEVKKFEESYRAETRSSKRENFPRDTYKGEDREGGEGKYKKRKIG